MTTTFDAVISFVRDEVNRGTSADNVIPTKILQAIQFIERNDNLKYMQHLQGFDLFADATLEAPYILIDNLKLIESIRTVDISAEGSGTFNYLTAMDNIADQKTLRVGVPCKYIQVGDKYVWFDAIPDEALDMHVSFYQYTGTISIDQSCWLFDNALDCVIAKTMQLMAPWLRQPALIGAYSPMLQEGMKTLFKANEDAKLANTSVTMGQDRGY
jgi:hypothetical protein